MRFQKVIFLAITVFAVSGFTDKKCNCDLDDDNLKGHVKQVLEDQKTEPSPTDTMHTLAKNDSVSGFSVWTYNELGNLNEKSYYDSKGRLVEQEKCKYDGRGEKTEDIHSHLVNGKMKTGAQYIYQKGKLTESFEFDTSGTKTYQFKYYNNDKGKVAQALAFYPGGVVERTVNKFKFDSLGRLIEEDNYTQDTLYSGKTTFKYDAMGNESEVVMYNKRDAIVHKRVLANTYDSAGRLVSKVEDFIKTEGILRFSRKWVFKYDSAGNRIEDDMYTIRGKIEQPGDVRLYEYDNTGNWVKRTDVWHNGEKHITMHTIQYY